MGKFVKGEVVVVPFPFTDLSNTKRRPALVLADLGGDDVILCMITSTFRIDGYSVPLARKDFIKGHIDHDSAVRPNRLFTADSNIIIYSLGTVSSSMMSQVETKLIEIIHS